MGDLSAGPEALDDFILIKSDGLPTYNFAHIVDDSEMQITHVIRGLEYISSIPKYLSLYEALEIKPPILACLPHVLTEDGKKKLGKRDGAKSIMAYREQGILPEALVNFLASLGWNDGTEQEIFSQDELIAKFSLERVQRAGARFDEKRLLWMNGHYIRQLSTDELYNRIADFWPPAATDYQKDYKIKVLELVKERLKCLSELPSLTGFFFSEPTPDLDLIRNNRPLQVLYKEGLRALLTTATEKLQASDFSSQDLTEKLNDLLSATAQPPNVLFSLIRIATTWAPFSPALAESLSILGKERTLQRLQAAVEALA
jgi:glutamyl-tRNA synthetase